MNRRTFNKLAGLAGIGALTGDPQQTMAHGIVPAATDPIEEVVLENEVFRVAFDNRSGALTRWMRKSTHWVIQPRPEYGISFRLLVPLPHQRANFVLGPKQQAVGVRKVSDHRVEFEWRNLFSEHGGVLPISLTATATLEDTALIFTATLTNDSELTIETIDYPYFGDLNPPSPAEAMSAESMWYANLESAEIHPRFENDHGYWGVRFPTKTIQSKRSNFCLIQARNQGIYAEMRDPDLTYLLEFTFEQHPGVIQSTENLVPEKGEISGMPVHLEFRTCHFVFVQAHARRQLVPVVLRTYDGDWHAGIDVYKKWRSSWFQQPHLVDWALDIHSWLQLQVDGAEQDFAIPYRALPKYIDECAENGVGAIQLVGWNLGGQDGGDPCLDTDPGLGTWDELHQAILYAQSRGVRMILFGKPIWADLTTDWFKRELYRYQATDPYGIPYETAGYSYTTPTQLAGINNRRRAIMDVQCPAYRDIATKEFRKILDLGAAGWLFDEVCHHGPVEYSFSPNHGYSAPGYIYGGDMPMARQFRDAADKVNRDFVFAGEGPQDWLLQYYPVSYFRIGDGSRPVCRYIDSLAPLMVAVTGIDDREKLNLILLYRYIISYEPFNFKGHVTDFPLSLSYGKKIDALRRKYKEWLWDAEFRDTLGATVTSDGPHRYSVFLAKSGKRAVVAVNQSLDREIVLTVLLDDPRRLRVATPELLDSVPTDGTVRIPPRSAAVVLEE
jgi:hypothetical protein